MDRNSSIGMPPFPTMKVCIGENFSLKILMPLLVVRRPLFTSIAMHCKILKSRLQNSQILSLLSFRIPLSGIPDGPILLIILAGRMLHVILTGRMLHVILTERMLHVILTEQSEWKDLLLFGSLLHRKRNGKPLMLSNTHSLPFPFRFFCPTLSS